MRANVSLLLTRLIVGGIFINAGWMKVSNMESTIGYFAQMNIPAFLAYAVGYIEFIGGIMVVLGLWTCLISAILAVIMLFAIWFSRSMGFQGMALPLVTLSALLPLVGVCGGKYSLKCCCNSDECDTCKVDKTEN